MESLSELARKLAAGTVTATSLLESCLDNAAGGEGDRVYIETLASTARERAAEMDRLRGAGAAPSRWSGIPISVKDLFDVAGQVTRAGSTCLAGAPPAARTAPAIERLAAAGFVFVGRTNMTEFAYSGVGINPHYGTPANPWDRDACRIPGGSSSGAAVSVTDGMAAAGIGTDTGGSCRIPAALTGITGYKPTASRIPREGVYPLSHSLDSVGSVAPTVGCCAVLDDIMAGGEGWLPEPGEVTGCRLAVLEHYVTDGMDETVAAGYQRALIRLEQAGAKLIGFHMPQIEQLPELNAGGGIAAAEAYAHHADQLAEHGAEYDPRVAGRIQAGAVIGESTLAGIRRARNGLIDAFARQMAGFDALLAPTVPVVAPPLDAFETDEEYIRLNLLLLRNPSLINFLDGCGISIPVHEPGEAPVGLMLAAPAGADRSLLGVAGTLEQVLRIRDA